MIISLTDLCNLKCPYCYAKNSNKNNVFMDTKTLTKLLNKMVEINDKDLRILGGEPTLHPEFEKIMKIVDIYKKKYDLKFTLFSNGTNLEKYLDIIPNWTTLIINTSSYNTPFKNKIDSLFKELTPISSFTNEAFGQKFFVSLSCVLCSEIDDYSYFWELVDKFNCKNIRISVASTSSKEFVNDRDLYFRTMKPKFLNFIKESYKRSCYLIPDCSYIPPCYFSGEELMLINQTFKEGYSSYSHCIFKTQIQPTGESSTCFGDINYNKIKSDVDNYKDIIYTDKEIEKLIDSHYLKKCSNCLLKDLKLCYAGCFCFKGEKND